MPRKVVFYKGERIPGGDGGSNYTAGDNITILNNVISSDQIEDQYNYTQYQNLPTETKMQDKIFMVQDAPKPKFAEYIQADETIYFQNGFVTYDSTTETIAI